MTNKTSQILSKTSQRGIILAPRNNGFPTFDIMNTSAHYENSIQSLPFISTYCLNNAYPECLNMPIRLSGHDTYFLPDEWFGLLPLLDQITGMEHRHNSSWREYFSYLSVEKRGDRQESNSEINLADGRLYVVTVQDGQPSDVSFTKNVSGSHAEKNLSSDLTLKVLFTRHRLSTKNATYNSMLNYPQDSSQ